MVKSALCGVAALLALGASLPQERARDYLVFVASEATDEVALVRFGARGGVVERKNTVGVNRAEPDGPHGLAVSPDKRHYYVTTAHGMPFGYVWKYTTVGDTLLGRAELGNFPASLQLSPDGRYAYIVNFNLHGEMVPSSVSVVQTSQMVEFARLTTCVMPHGSRLTADGSKHYSVCMMDDMLVEIDARSFEVKRGFRLTKGSEGPSAIPLAPAAGAASGSRATAATGADVHDGHGMVAPAAGSSKCSPTWAVPSRDGARIFVACNTSSEIVEVSAADWRVLRRIPAGEGVYNLALTGDGRLLIASNKRGRSVSVIETASGRELARIATVRTVVHGVAISDDDRYAFVSVEGYGAEPGTLEMIDLRTFARVASADVGQMAGGVDFWRSELR